MRSCYLDHPTLKLEIGSRSYMDMCTKCQLITDKYKIYEFRTVNNWEHWERLVFHTSSKEKLRIWMDLNNLKVSPSEIRWPDINDKNRMFAAYITLRTKA